MVPYRINDKCEFCGSCVDGCLIGVVEKEDGACRTDTEKCEGRGSCSFVCSSDAIYEA
jgi:MinD superfamily P-loop ATPase